MVFLVYESVFPLSHVICPQIHVFKHFIKYPACNHPLHASEQPSTDTVETWTWFSPLDQFLQRSRAWAAGRGPGGYCSVMCTASPRGLPCPCQAHASAIYFYWFYCQVQRSEKRITSHEQHVLFLQTDRLCFNLLLCRITEAFITVFADCQTILSHCSLSSEGEKTRIIHI